MFRQFRQYFARPLRRNNPTPVTQDNLHPLHRTNNMGSPLIKLIKKLDTINALALIETGNSNPEIVVDGNGKTALIYACQLGINSVALALIRICQPETVGQIDIFRKTALIYACETEMSDVALALIQTGNSKPEQVNRFGKTALIYACRNELGDVALALIATGQSNPGHPDGSGRTALMESCLHQSMSAVALALIATGQSNPELVDQSGRTALSSAQEHGNMQEVVNLLLQNPQVAAQAAAPVAPPVAQRGVAFEIHNFFNLLDINKITKFITQFNESNPEFNNNVQQPFVLNPLLSPLINFVNNTYPENVKQEKINGLTSINASIASYGGYVQILPLLKKVITFVSKQSDEFITLYIDMLKYDCLNAYAGSNRSSCIKGMVERIITVLKDVAIGLLTKDPDNENYVKLKDIFMEFNEVVQKWSDTYLVDGPKHSELEALTKEGERENHFITFMVNEYGGSEISDPMRAKINTEAVKFRDGGVFERMQWGGNKKRYKIKTHKKKSTRKKSTRKKLQKGYKKVTKKQKYNMNEIYK